MWHIKTRRGRKPCPNLLQHLFLSALLTTKVTSMRRVDYQQFKKKNPYMPNSTGGFFFYESFMRLATQSDYAVL